MKIEPARTARPRLAALACSGLGRIRRGNETWARVVGPALHDAGEPVRLLGGGPLEVQCPYEWLWNVPRDSPWLRSWLSWSRRYVIEQRTFLLALRRRWRGGEFDIVHLADPLLAELARRAGPAAGVEVIFKDGMLLGPEWCSRFPWVQVLAPFYREEAERQGFDTRAWFVIPHMVDTGMFHPATERETVRREIWGEALAADAFVVLAVGDLSPSSHKRLDWIVDEFARLGDRQARLLVAGQATPAELRAFQERTSAKLGQRVRVLTNLDPRQMVQVYQSADVFAHAALREPFGIVFVEAMATGLPVLAHTFPVTRWIVGDAGEALDMEAPGALAAALQSLMAAPGRVGELSARARARAISVFGQHAIVELYREAYRVIRTRIEAAP